LIITPLSFIIFITPFAISITPLRHYFHFITPLLRHAISITHPLLLFDAIIDIFAFIAISLLSLIDISFHIDIDYLIHYIIDYFH
jgi:hypothetical protein